MEATNVKLALAVLLLGSVLTGCNTVEGVGKDVQEGGEAIEDAGDGD